MARTQALTRGRILIGTAGWSIPRAQASKVAADGTHLHRYASVLPCVEINSSFYRSHKRSTYARWAASTPSHFRFSVKVPRAITHEQALCGAERLLDGFLDETAGLGTKRGPLLVQLPPSLAFDADVAGSFFTSLRARHRGPIVCEPRHATWFEEQAEALLVCHRVARVAADPGRAPGADVPGGWPGLIYVRLHGSPRMYWSRYSEEYLAALADRLRQHQDREVWCVFDNTAMGTALDNALALSAKFELPGDLGRAK